MDEAEILERLLALAREAELPVRALRSSADEAAPARSGVCRVYGALEVVLVEGDPLRVRIAVVARALQSHAPELAEVRFLPPAVRARLDAAAPDTQARPDRAPTSSREERGPCPGGTTTQERRSRR